MVKIFLKKKLSDRLSKGHQWIFASEVASVSGSFRNGEWVQAFTAAGSCVGTGFAATMSSIGVRLFSREQIDFFDPEPFLKAAFEARKQLKIPIPRCLFHGDADGISGLNVLEYEHFIVLQSLTAGIDDCLPKIEAFVSTQLQKEIFWHQSANLRIKEGAEMIVSPQVFSGQKLTFGNISYDFDSLDELLSYNLSKETLRDTIENLDIKGLVWDVFCGNANLGATAASTGVQVLAIDNEPSCLQNVQKTAVANQLSIKTNEANAFDFLKEKTREAPELIILDPPAFSTKEGLAAYKAINLSALQQLRKQGGWLLTGYNTSTIEPAIFLEMLRAASLDAKTRCTIFQHVEQRADWPMAEDYPYTRLFYFWLVRVVSV